MHVVNEDGLSRLHYPNRDRTMIWHRRSRGVWGFARLAARPLPNDPRAMLDSIMSESVVVQEGEASHGSTPPEVSGGETISDSDLAELAIQTWRLQNRINGLDPVEHKRIRKSLTDSARRFSKILERFEVEFEDVTGQPYVRGWQEVEVVSWEEPGDETPPVDDGPWVKSTVSPIVRKQGRAMKLGQIVCVDVEG